MFSNQSINQDERPSFEEESIDQSQTQTDLQAIWSQIECISISGLANLMTFDAKSFMDPSYMHSLLGSSLSHKEQLEIMRDNSPQLLQITGSLIAGLLPADEEEIRHFIQLSESINSDLTSASTALNSAYQGGNRPITVSMKDALSKLEDAELKLRECRENSVCDLALTSPPDPMSAAQSLALLQLLDAPMILKIKCAKSFNTVVSNIKNCVFEFDAVQKGITALKKWCECIIDISNHSTSAANQCHRDIIASLSEVLGAEFSEKFSQVHNYFSPAKSILQEHLKALKNKSFIEKQKTSKLTSSLDVDSVFTLGGISGLLNSPEAAERLYALTTEAQIYSEFDREFLEVINKWDFGSELRPLAVKQLWRRWQNADLEPNQKFVVSLAIQMAASEIREEAFGRLLIQPQFLPKINSIFELTQLKEILGLIAADDFENIRWSDGISILDSIYDVANSLSRRSKPNIVYLMENQSEIRQHPEALKLRQILIEQRDGAECICGIFNLDNEARAKLAINYALNKASSDKIAQFFNRLGELSDQDVLALANLDAAELKQQFWTKKKVLEQSIDAQSVPKKANVDPSPRLNESQPLKLSKGRPWNENLLREFEERSDSEAIKIVRRFFEVLPTEFRGRARDIWLQDKNVFIDFARHINKLALTNLHHIFLRESAIYGAYRELLIKNPDLANQCINKICRLESSPNLRREMSLILMPEEEDLIEQLIPEVQVPPHLARLSNFDFDRLVLVGFLSNSKFAALEELNPRFKLKLVEPSANSVNPEGLNSRDFVLVLTGLMTHGAEAGLRKYCNSRDILVERFNTKGLDTLRRLVVYLDQLPSKANE